MPYISRNRQHQLDPLIQQIVDAINIEDYGDIEYVFFSILQIFSQNELRRFKQMNALVGVLETTKLEYVERILKLYESLKLIDNWAEGTPEE